MKIKFLFSLTFVFQGLCVFAKSGKNFAQADVDRPVNNLTRFKVFFPDRKQYFRENSSINSSAESPELKSFFRPTMLLEI
jgi:hypothetical protein